MGTGACGTLKNSVFPTLFLYKDYSVGVWEYISHIPVFIYVINEGIFRYNIFVTLIPKRQFNPFIIQSIVIPYGTFGTIVGFEMLFNVFGYNSVRLLFVNGLLLATDGQ